MIQQLRLVELRDGHNLQVTTLSSVYAIVVLDRDARIVSIRGGFIGAWTCFCLIGMRGPDQYEDSRIEVGLPFSFYRIVDHPRMGSTVVRTDTSRVVAIALDSGRAEVPGETATQSRLGRIRARLAVCRWTKARK